MNIICAIAKNEQLYIKDWVEYHLAQGWDHIYIYDNSDSEGDCLSKYYNNDNLTYITRTIGMHREMLQLQCYQTFYNNNSFDWCAFIDLDEFIVLDTPLQEFLDSFPETCGAIKLNWHMYGDDNLVERDTSVPVYEAITHRLKDHYYERNGKMIIRGGIPRLKIYSNHDCHHTDRYQADHKLNNLKLFNYRNHETCYVAHYMTKTLSEFINQKMQRTDACFANRRLDLEYFWKLNEKTPEKLQYIEEHV